MPREIAIENFNPMEVPVGDLVSRVPELLSNRGWGAIDLIRRGLSYSTAYRVARGDTEVTLKIAKLLCDIFELDSLDQIFSYIPDGKNGSGH